MYSVSPRRTPQIFGGKNSEKRSTRMPTAFAAMKCPNSCSTISTMKPRMVRTQLIGSVWQPRSSGQRANRFAGDGARLAIGLVERLEHAHRRGVETLERLLDHGWDAVGGEPLAAGSVHGALVGGVQDAGRGAAGLRGLAREAQAGEDVE